MRYWYDTEFIEDGKTIDLISIGVVSSDGREFYAQNLECDFSKANDWVRENVLPHLTSFDLKTLQPIINPDIGYGDWWTRSALISRLSALISRLAYSQAANASVVRLPDPDIEMWGYYSAYDHVALCQLFGTMMDLPKGWPMYTRDIKQLCDSLGNPRLPEQGKGEHNALADARWNKTAWEFLQRRLAPQSSPALSKLAEVYARIPRLRTLCGESHVTAEQILHDLCNDLRSSDDGVSAFCHGHGEPHIYFIENPSVFHGFEFPCVIHSERRKRVDRRYSQIVNQEI